MIPLKELSNTLSPENQVAFIHYLKVRNKRRDNKNLTLFKLLTQHDLDFTTIQKKLYKDQKKAAYHALRKRLYSSLIDFIANKGMEEENSIEMQIIKLIIASRNLLQQKQFNIAQKILKKAEKKAQDHFLFTLLNEIYHTQIQYAHVFPETALEHLIEKFNKNHQEHLNEEKLNIACARIKNKLNDFIAEGKKLDLNDFLEKNLKESNISIETQTFKSLYQLISLASLSAFTSKNYLSIETFVINTYNKIKSHKSNQKQLYYHIQINYLIANMYFRNKKFQLAIEFLDKMEEQMKERKSQYFKIFDLKHKNLLALTHNYSGNIEKAIQIAETGLKKITSDIETKLDMQLCLVMYYFQKQEFNKANKILIQLYHTDKWYESKTGKEWVIKKSLIEILLHIELNNIDIIESRLISFKRKYYDYLKKIKQSRVITFLSFIEEYYKCPEIIATDKYKQKIENSFVFLDPTEEDIFVISFYSWLKSKMKKENLYQTTIKLVNIYK
ncbi:MAG: hypothetical protein HRT68_09005 [Flavobacteriaceae bacterium]|nr:hypothetical protein [Flavobacteriaceae bacterium]